MRTRKQLGRQQSSHIKRLQKTLESANVKLDSVITDIVGKSGRAMIQALIAGETDPVKLAALADRRIRASAQQLREALRGRVTDHHRFLLYLHLQHIELAEAAIQDIDRNVTALITRMDQEVEAGQASFQSSISLLTTIPGIDVLAAWIILSEIGLDMTRSPTAGHLLSWAGSCPRNNESAGKRHSTRLRKDDRWLKTLLVQCAWAAKRKKAATSMPSSIVSPRDVDQRRQSAPSRPRSSPRSTTCSRTAPNSRISVPRRSKESKAKRLVVKLAKLGFDARLTPLAQAA